MKIIFSKKNITIIFCTYIALIVMGAFLDLDVSVLSYRENSMYFNIATSISVLPLSFFCIFGGTLIHFSDNRKVKTFTYIREIIAIVSILFGMYYVYHENESTLPVTIIEILVIASLALFFGYKCKNKNKKLLTRIGLFILFTIYFSTCFVYFSKFVFCRPRFAWLTKSGLENYRDFWQIDRQLKEASIAAGVDKHMFRSFPSGHACSATTILLTSCLPLLFKKLKGIDLLLYMISIFFVIVICLGRIVGGFNYISDVVIGSFVTIVGMIIGEKVLMRAYE